MKGKMKNDDKKGRKERGHEGTAPKKGETEDADRMEGSFEPTTDADEEEPKSGERDHANKGEKG